MNTVHQILTTIYQSCPSAYERRADLLAQMQLLNKSNINCNKCPGHCCTYQYNSMQVDPLQAIELYCDLDNKNELSDEFWDRIAATIKDYRLDNELLLGPGKYIRRYYTCTFFKTVEGQGCPIDASLKPYGCLAYNPKTEGTFQSDKCSSELSLLEVREKKFEKYELEARRYIQAKLNLWWDKKPLPVALLEIHKNVKGNN